MGGYPPPHLTPFFYSPCVTTALKPFSLFFFEGKRPRGEGPLGGWWRDNLWQIAGQKERVLPVARGTRPIWGVPSRPRGLPSQSRAVGGYPHLFHCIEAFPPWLWGLRGLFQKASKRAFDSNKLNCFCQKKPSCLFYLICMLHVHRDIEWTTYCRAASSVGVICTVPTVPTQGAIP